MLLERYIPEGYDVSSESYFTVREISLFTLPGGDRCGTMVKVLCYKWEVAGSIPAGAIGIFH